MYQSLQLSGLGLSLKPPKWLRNTVRDAINKVTVTVPTGVGPVTLTPAQAAAAARGAQVTYSTGPKPPSPMDAANDFVSDKVPGGWVGLALGGAALYYFMSKRRRRGRRR